MYQIVIFDCFFTQFMIELQQAEITGFLRTILFLLFFYYAFKFFARLLGPYILKKAVNKMKEKAEQQHKKQQEPTVKNGETVIDKRPQQRKESNKDVGEYVDFEELE